MSSKVFMVIRYLVAVAMIVFGANKLVAFMPAPDPSTMSEGMQNLMSVLAMKSPFMKIIGVLEVACGLALALNKYVPLSLTILAAIMFNAFLVHLFFGADQIAGAAVFLALVLALIYHNKERFKGILAA
jgi:putative oxidoreductase